MISKNFVNKLLGKFGVELHGKGYLKKLGRESGKTNAFEVQQKLTGGKAATIFDVGANRGDVTRQYRALFPSAAIHAFEPFPDFHNGFREEFGKDPSIRLNPFALSDKRGRVDFYVNQSADTNSLLKPAKIGASSDNMVATRNITQIDTLTLDEYCSENHIEQIDILKMDTQGSELSILKGAASLLRDKKIGLIYTEAYFKNQYKEQPLFYEIAAWLGKFGYHLEDIYDPYYNDRFLLWCDAIFLPE